MTGFKRRSIPVTMSTPNYDADFTGGRIMSDWTPSQTNPFNLLTNHQTNLQKKSQSLVRNNQWAQRALAAHIANEVGTGIRPRPATSNKEVNQALRELWKIAHPSFDYTGSLDAYGLQSLIARTRRESGEAFVRIIKERKTMKSPVPIKFQVLESSFCPIGYSKHVSENVIIEAGIEMQLDGKILAYHLYPGNPDIPYIAHDYSKLIRVPANEVIHTFIPKRPGQMRGEPDGVSGYQRTHMFEKYDQAELTRKETRASFTGVIERPTYDTNDYKFDPISGMPLTTDENDVPMVELEAGSFPQLLPGESINLFDADDPGRGYKDFQYNNLLAIAAAYNIPYQLLTGDYQGINDRVWRAIMNQYHRELEQMQQQIMVQQVCRPMWEAFVKRAIVVGAINTSGLEYYKLLMCEHRPQAWSHIHPLQDIQKDVLLKDSGLKSRQKIIDEYGGETAEEVDLQRLEDQEREDELGLRNEIDEGMGATGADNSDDDGGDNNSPGGSNDSSDDDSGNSEGAR